MTPEKVIEVQKYGRAPISLQTPLGEDGDSEFGDLIEDSEATQPGEAVSFTLAAGLAMDVDADVVTHSRVSSPELGTSHRASCYREKGLSKIR